MNQHILFVDDENNILSSLRRSFLQESYTVHLASSAKEGLDILKKNENMAVIVSDMRMPEKDGISFLKESCTICPDAVRMLLSAYADIQSVMKAINEGRIWRYITKPWDDNDLHQAIRNGIEFYTGTVERKRLLKELEQKNGELLNLNVRLEAKVKERTWQIQARSGLLSMLLETDDYFSVLEKSCEIVKEAVAGEEVCLYITGADRYVSAQSGGRYSVDIKAYAEASQADKPLESNGCFFLPLRHKGETLAVLSVRKGVGGSSSLSLNEFESSVEGFVSVILLTIRQHRSVQDAPLIINQIEDILNKLK